MENINFPTMKKKQIKNKIPQKIIMLIEMKGYEDVVRTMKRKTIMLIVL